MKTRRERRKKTFNRYNNIAAKNINTLNMVKLLCYTLVDLQTRHLWPKAAVGRVRAAN